MDSQEATGAATSSKASSPGGVAGKVVIVVENLPLPFDRRVWRECEALRDAGYHVTAIAPKDPARAQPKRERLDGISIYRYTPRHADAGLVAYIIEYLVAVVMSGWLLGKVLRREGFDVVQICNPPDLLILAAAPFKLLGKRVVFDQHDVCPEIYMAQKGLDEGSKSLVLRALYFFEWLTYRLADVVLVVNESCRRVALARGGKPSEAVHIVRNGPVADSIRDVEAVPELKAGARHLLVYVGMMGPQDGIDVLLRVIRDLADMRSRSDFTVRVIGSGPVLDSMRRYAVELGVETLVTFTGSLPHSEVLQNIASADVCLCPDPKTPLSDVCSLVKSMEYMGLAKPFVAFNLSEVRESAGDSALYADSGLERDFAQKIQVLLDNEEMRFAMGRRGREKVLRSLTWDQAAKKLVNAYAMVFKGIKQRL